MISDEIKSVALRCRVGEELGEPGDSLRVIFDAIGAHGGSCTVGTPGITDGWSANFGTLGRPEVVDWALKNGKLACAGLPYV